MVGAWSKNFPWGDFSPQGNHQKSLENIEQQTALCHEVVDRIKYQSSGGLLSGVYSCIKLLEELTELYQYDAMQEDQENQPLSNDGVPNIDRPFSIDQW